MFNKHDIRRNACQLFGSQAKHGYDWWWHSFTAHHAETGKEQPFYIEYFLCNPASGSDKPVFGQLPKNQENGVRPSYLMVNVGAWGENGCQLHRFFSWDNIKVDFGVPYSVEAADCFATETFLKGSVSVSKEDVETHPEWMSDRGSMSWYLQVDKKVVFNVGYGASYIMHKLQLFEMFWHAEGMKTAFSGEIVWNGEKYLVTPETCFGYADKNWGKDFTTPWVWLSSNNLRCELTGNKLTDSVFNIGGGKPKIGGIALDRKLLSAFWYEGKPYEFNFSKFWTYTRTKFHGYETDEDIIWHIEQLLINYESPNGKKRHTRLWNGGNGIGTVYFYRDGKLIDRFHAENIGYEYGEFDATEAYH